MCQRGPRGASRSDGGNVQLSGPVKTIATDKADWQGTWFSEGKACRHRLERERQGSWHRLRRALKPSGPRDPAHAPSARQRAICRVRRPVVKACSPERTLRARMTLCRAATTVAPALTRVVDRRQLELRFIRLLGSSQATHWGPARRRGLTRKAERLVFERHRLICPRVNSKPEGLSAREGSHWTRGRGLW